MEKFDEKDGVWRTIGGRRIFIRDGESISDAMKRSNRYPSAENKRDYAEDTAEKVRKELAEKNKEPAPRLTATAEKYLKRSVEEKESSGINRQESVEPKREPKIVSSNEVLSTLKNATSWEDIHSAISAVDDAETRKHLIQEAKELEDADSDVKGSASYLRSEAMLYGVEDNMSSSDKVYRNAYEDYLKEHPASRLTFAEFKKYME